MSMFSQLTKQTGLAKVTPDCEKRTVSRHPYVQWSPISRRPWGVHESDGRIIKRCHTAIQAFAYLNSTIKAASWATGADRAGHPRPGRVGGARQGSPYHDLLGVVTLLI